MVHFTLRTHSNHLNGKTITRIHCDLSCDLWHKLTKGNCKLDHRGLFSPNRAHKNWLPYKQTFH
ncbi:Uncharacterised protein [Vibrio cholerae]|nr:Uncharacterised protein [Vibrio cholerae]